MLNATLDAYAGWRDQCSAVDVARCHWADARGNDAAVWYSAYSAALNGEERASEYYARLIRRLGDFAAADLEPMTGLAAAAVDHSSHLIGEARAASRTLLARGDEVHKRLSLPPSGG
jgi:hypothetical protein